MKYTEIKKLEAILVLVDFEKAFDRVEYSAMYKILSFFGIGEHFIEMTKILFQDFYLSITNAGHLSEFYTPTRTLFQGNPIASFLFVTIVEILAINLRKNETIDCITIQGIKYLLSQFADDLDLFMKANAKSLEAAFKELILFQKLTGMKINVEKTTVRKFGSCKNSNAKFYTQFNVNVL